MAGAELIPTGVFCELTGLSRRRQQYWTKTGILRPKRDGNGYCLWTVEDVLRVLVTARIRDVYQRINPSQRRLRNKRGFMNFRNIRLLTGRHLAAPFLLACQERPDSLWPAYPITLRAAGSEGEVLRIGSAFTGCVVLIPVAEFRAGVVRKLEERRN